MFWLQGLALRTAPDRLHGAVADRCRVWLKAAWIGASGGRSAHLVVGEGIRPCWGFCRGVSSALLPSHIARQNGGVSEQDAMPRADRRGESFRSIHQAPIPQFSTCSLTVLCESKSN